MMHVWVMSKSFPSTTGDLPVAWSYGYNHAAMGYENNGWGLVWLSLDIHQLMFLKAKIDPNVEVIGKESSKPTQLLLDTYADRLAGDGPYTTVQQVLDRLGELEPRFWLERNWKNF